MRHELLSLVDLDGYLHKIDRSCDGVNNYQWLSHTPGSACLEISIPEQGLPLCLGRAYCFPNPPPFSPLLRNELFRIIKFGATKIDLGRAGFCSCQPDSIILIISSTATSPTFC